MANALYDSGRAAIAGDLDLTAASIKACIVNPGYSPNLATDEFLSDVPSGQIVATVAAAFTGVTVNGGVFDADNISFAAVGASVTAAPYIVIYEDTGSSASSRLIAFIDTATGLPVTPNGGDITVAWDAGANKIFKL